MAAVDKQEWPICGATLEEAAAALRVNKRTLMEHIRDSPSFPARKVGRAWRIDLKAVERWLDGHDMPDEDEESE